nr:RNA-directed DNA polymerase, eukaryota [Tanacetum cinerariifolium]
MSTSSNTTFEFDVNHNGEFKLNPLTYQYGSLLNIHVLQMDFEDMSQRGKFLLSDAYGWSHGCACPSLVLSVRKIRRSSKRRKFSLQITTQKGFSVQRVVYPGGLWVMFELPSANSKSKFLAHVGVGSWFKSLSNPQPDFSPRDRIIWVDVEGVPIHACFSNMFHKVGSMWGEVLELGDCKDECFARKMLCIKTNRDDNILEKFKIIVKGKSFVVRAKELFVWSPSFVEVTEADVTHEEGEFIQNKEEGLEKPIHQTNVEEESDIEAISETFFGDQADDLNEENKDVNAAATNSSIPFPPGFTPDKLNTDVGESVARKDQFQPDVKSVGRSSHTMESANNVDDQFSTRSIENIQKKKDSGSILEILEEMILVGQTMGFSMECSIKDMERIIDLKGADDVVR